MLPIVNWELVLATFLFFHTGLSGSLKLPKNSTATGTIVHQKFAPQAATRPASSAVSDAPNTVATRHPAPAATTSPSPRQNWKTPVPRPRISGGSVSVRYIGMTTAM